MHWHSWHEVGYINMQATKQASTQDSMEATKQATKQANTPASTQPNTPANTLASTQPNTQTLPVVNVLHKRLCHKLGSAIYPGRASQSVNRSVLFLVAIIAPIPSDL